MKTKTILASKEIKALRILVGHLRDIAVCSTNNDTRDNIHNIADQLYNLTLKQA